MKWWRFYSEALDDPKVQLLPPPTFKGWVNLLNIVNETEPSRGNRSGYLPSRLEDIAYKLHMTVQDTDSLITDLVTAGLFEGQPGRYRAHKWPKRQPVSDDVSARVSKSRRGDTGNGNETLHARNKYGQSTANVRPQRERRVEEKRGDSETDQDLDLDPEAEAENARSFADRLRPFGLRLNTAVVQEAIAESGESCVQHCLEEAELHNKLSFAYVDQIRRRHGRDGCPNPDLRTRAERMVGRSMN